MPHGLPRWTINNAVDKGYTLNTLEEARKLLVEAYYCANFAHWIEDSQKSTRTISKTVEVEGMEAEWEVTVFDIDIDGEEGAQLLHTYEGETVPLIDLSHWELRNLWERSRH